MLVTLELPEAVLQQVEGLAKRQGVTAAELIRQLVDAHLENRRFSVRHSHDVHLPLIPASETGSIGPFNGADIDEIVFGDYFPS
jgi:hypothetical protein